MSQTPRRVLTGIKPSGTPHIGNYVGAIRPAVLASTAPDTESFFFLADLHSLVSTHDPVRVQRSTLEIAAAWLAAGLDPARVRFYRQSDIPEITELCWLLTCVAGKGQLNRAHAYKAAVDRNRAEGEDDDAAISAGLFMYPVLMAADILLFNAHQVPVGRDQVQHIEMARDFGQRFNHLYGAQFTLPEAVIEAQVATLPGLDGRKMSKSYDNVIGLSATREELRRLIFSIVTDSRAPGEPKQVEGSALFDLYRAFATPDETAQLRDAFASGIAWGEAKTQVFERIDAEIAPLRERFTAWQADAQAVEQLLCEGAQRLREEVAIPMMRQLRQAVGLRALSRPAGGPAATEAPALPALPQFKQYRHDDGLFYFKLVQGERIVLQSGGFSAPREAGQLVGRLKAGAGTGVSVRDGQLFVDDTSAGWLGEAVTAGEVIAALDRLSDAAA